MISLEGKTSENEFSLERERQTMDQFQMNLNDFEELDPIESPACIIGTFFIVST